MVRGGAAGGLEAGGREARGGEVTYVIGVLCREVLYRRDGALGNELPVGGRRLLLHNLSLHPGQRGEDAGRNEGCSVTGGASRSSLSQAGHVSSLRTQARTTKLCPGFPESQLRSPPSVSLLSAPRPPLPREACFRHLSSEEHPVPQLDNSRSQPMSRSPERAPLPASPSAPHGNGWLHLH